MPPDPETDEWERLTWREACALAALAASFAAAGLLLASIPTGLPPAAPPAPSAFGEPTPAAWTPAVDPALYHRLGLDPVPVNAAPDAGAEEPPLVTDPALMPGTSSLVGEP